MRALRRAVLWGTRALAIGLAVMVLQVALARFMNLALLLFVVAIPFGTALMATYLTEGGADSHWAMIIYCGIFEGMAISFAAIFGWSLGEGRRHHPIPVEAQRSAWVRFAIGGLIYIIAIAVAVLSAPAALAIVGLVAVYYIFERTSAGT